MTRAATVASHGFAVLVLAVYAVVAGTLASRKPLWLDEIMTLEVCRSANWQEVWGHLGHGPMNDPPLLYLLARSSIALFGETLLAFRLPSLLGVLVFAASVYVFVLRRCPVAHARLALVLCLLPPVMDYAVEARPYGLWLAFTGLGLLCWQTATGGGRWRGLALAGLAACSALAVCSHFYAVLSVGLIGVAELHRGYVRRRLDLPVLLALAAGAVPLAWFGPLIANGRSVADNAWSRPRLGNLTASYREILGVALPVFPVLLVGLAVASGPRSTDAPRALPRHEVAAALSLLLLPAAAYLLAVTVTNSFHGRYALPAVWGAAVLAAAAVGRADGPRNTLGQIAVGFAALVLAANLLAEAGSPTDAPARTAGRWSLVRATLDRAEELGCPWLTDDVSLFVESRHHLPASAPRSVFVCDTGTSVDEVARRLRPWHDAILEANELKRLGRFLFVPELHQQPLLEAQLRKQNATFTLLPPLDGKVAYLVEMPREKK